LTDLVKFNLNISARISGKNLKDGDSSINISAVRKLKKKEKKLNYFINKLYRLEE